MQLSEFSGYCHPGRPDGKHRLRVVSIVGGRNEVSLTRFALMEGRPMPAEPLARKPGEDWIAIVRKNGMPEFAAAFAPNPVLHTSVMSGPCTGVEAVAAVFAATAGDMYDTLVFTYEAVDGPKTYLEWEGRAFGKSVGGATILTRNEAGLIQSIQIYHRPLHMVLQFSTELENRLKGKISPSLFAALFTS